jgi:hypothetical protein
MTTTTHSSLLVRLLIVPLARRAKPVTRLPELTVRHQLRIGVEYETESRLVRKIDATVDR